MKLVRESINDEIEDISFSLKNLTWDDIKPEEKKDYWGNPIYVNVPHDFMSSESLSAEVQFNRWYKEFIKRYGTEGELFKTRSNNFDIRGNEKWDKAKEKGKDSVMKFYANKKSGDYIGD